MTVLGTTGKWVNLALFQAGWLICVLAPGALAALAVFGLVGVHLALISRHPAIEARFILLGTLLGSLLDGLWFQLGVMAGSGVELVWTPFWLVAIWAIFMTTLAHSLAWMTRPHWVPFVLPPLAGPFAYWSASALGAVRLPDLAFSLPALALGWLIIFPLLMRLRVRLFPELT